LSVFAPFCVVFFPFQFTINTFCSFLLNLSFLHLFCSFNKSFAKVPSDPTEPYIMDFRIEDSPNGELRVDLLISSKEIVASLLRRSPERWLIAVDHTYQTNVEKFPLLMFGRTTVERHYLPLGAMKIQSHKLSCSGNFCSVR